MARAITWQDVQAPRGGIAAALAVDRAGQSIANAVSGFGDVARGINADMTDAATGAAIATIANSQDPAAAAAAVPKGWQFDPLAIASAANARTDQLLDTKVKGASLRSSEANIDDLLSKKQDRESARMIASKVEPYAPLARAGKEFEIDTADPFWETAAGFDARKYLDGLRNEGFNQRAEGERLAQGRAAARAAELQLKMTQQRMAAEDQFAAYKLTPEGSEGNQARDQRMARDIGVRTGAGEAFGLTLQSKLGDVKGLATPDELLANSTQGPTYDAAVKAIDAKRRQQEENQLVTDALTQVQAEGALADKANNYKDLTPAALNQALIKNNPRVVDRALGLGLEEDDVGERRAYQNELAADEAAGYAKKHGLTIPKGLTTFITPQQEASLAELTFDALNVTNSEKVDSAAARAMRERYVVLNLTGGREAHDKRVANSQAATAAELAKLDALRQRTVASAISKGALPDEALTYWNQSEAGQARSALMNDLQRLSK
jgi:hypothetical protein